MTERSPLRESMSEELWAFYSYIFENEIPKEIGSSSHRIFEGNVSLVRFNIENYIIENEDTPAKILFTIEDSRMALPWLSACDPESNLFIVVGPNEFDKV